MSDKVVLQTQGKLGAGTYTLQHTGPQIDALLTKTEGLYNYDDTEIRALIQALEEDKVDKVEGKGLSTNDFTNGYKKMVRTTNNEVVEARGDYESLNARLDDMSGGGGGGTKDYRDLTNKPKINGHELIGNLSTDDLDINTDYLDLDNKPQINGHELVGNLSTEDLGIEQDYLDLDNKPQINGHELVGNLSTDDLGIEVSYPDLTDKPQINGHELVGNLTTDDLDLEIDYVDLTSKPSINGHILVGDLSTEELGIQQMQADWNQTDTTAVDYVKNKPDLTTILYGTTASWNAQPTLVSRRKTIYVYSDYQVIQGKNVPGFKVGDGVTLVINLPFTGTEGGVSDAERDSWNNKVTASLDPSDEENLILSTN